MTPVCGVCRNALPEASRFCGVCGTPVDAAPAAPAAPGHTSREYAPVRHPTSEQAQPGPQVEHNPFARGSGSSTSRSVVDNFLSGDWPGAALAAIAAVGAMAVLALVAGLLFGLQDVGARALITFVLVAVAAGFGGDVHASAEVFASSSGSSGLGVLPLTLTLVGCGTLVLVHALRQRKAETQTGTVAWLQVLRVGLVLSALLFVVAILSRNKMDQGEDAFLPDVSVGVGVLSSVVGGFLFVVGVLGLNLLVTRPNLLHPRGRWLRDRALPVLAAAGAFFGTGLVMALAGLIYTLAAGDNPAQQVGIALLLFPNAAIVLVLLSLGVPLTVTGSLGTGLAEGLTGLGLERITVFTFTEASAWFWLSPVVVIISLLILATLIVLRQNSIPDARREGLRFAGAMACVAFVAALLTRIVGQVAGFGMAAFSGEGQLTFNPVVAAFIAALWGAAAGVVAPVLAGRIPSATVHAVRRRFGTAAPPAAQGQTSATDSHFSTAPHPHSSAPPGTPTTFPGSEPDAPPQQPGGTPPSP